VYVVELIREVTDDLIESLQRLIPQLTSTPPPDRKQLEAIVVSDAARLLVARDSTNRIMGTLTLVVFPIPTGVRAWIEDVIVDDQARGQGVGAALTQEALSLDPPFVFAGLGIGGRLMLRALVSGEFFGAALSGRALKGFAPGPAPARERG